MPAPRFGSGVCTSKCMWFDIRQNARHLQRLLLTTRPSSPRYRARSTSSRKRSCRRTPRAYPWWIAFSHSSRGRRIPPIGAPVGVSPHLKRVRPRLSKEGQTLFKLGGREDREDVGEGGDDVGCSCLDECGGVSVAVDADPDRDSV